MEFLKKNAGLIILVAAILLVVWYFFLRKKPTTESSYDSNLPILGGDSSFKATPDCPPNHIFKPCCGCVPKSDLKPTASMQ